MLDVSWIIVRNDAPKSFQARLITLKEAFRQPIIHLVFRIQSIWRDLIFSKEYQQNIILRRKHWSYTLTYWMVTSSLVWGISKNAWND